MKYKQNLCTHQSVRYQYTGSHFAMHFFWYMAGKEGFFSSFYPFGDSGCIGRSAQCMGTCETCE